MRTTSRLRASSALWAAPLALGLPLYYYYLGPGMPPSGNHGYAPTLTSYPLAFTYPFAYAVASALAAWESGRLRREGVWALAPARSRYRVAAHALAPVVGLAWLMMILPVATSLAAAGVWPTLASLAPLPVGMAVCCAQAALGFSVGLRLPRIVVAPLLAAGVWALVAFSRATTPFWLRHISGQPAERLMFGEEFTFRGLVPHVLFTGAIAVGVALLWLPVRALALRVAVVVTAAAVALSGTLGGYLMVRDWGHNPPLATGRAPMTCAGTGPKVCVPSVVDDELPAVREDVLAVLADLRAAGVDEHPELVTDSLNEGRYIEHSTGEIWHASLTRGHDAGTLRYLLVGSVVRYDCDRVDLATARALNLWTATVVGEGERYRRAVKAEPYPFEGQAQVETEVAEVLEQPKDRQAAWFHRNLADACGTVR